jgi:hypothetical protein
MMTCKSVNDDRLNPKTMMRSPFQNRQMLR